MVTMVKITSTVPMTVIVLGTVFGIFSIMFLILLCAKRQKDDQKEAIADGQQGTFEMRKGSHLEENKIPLKENATRRSSSPSTVLQMDSERRSSSQASQCSASSHSSRHRNKSDALPNPEITMSTQENGFKILPVDFAKNSAGIDRKYRSKTMPAREQRAPYDTSDGSDETYARVNDVPKPAENAYLVVDLKGKEEQYELIDSELQRKRRAASTPESDIASAIEQMKFKNVEVVEATPVDPNIFNIGVERMQASRENSGGSGVYAMVNEEADKKASHESEKHHKLSKLSVFKKSVRGQSNTSPDHHHQDKHKRKGSKKFLKKNNSQDSVQPVDVSPPPPIPPLESLKFIAQEHRKSVHTHSVSEDDSRSMKSFGSSPGTPIDSPRLNSVNHDRQLPARPSFEEKEYETLDQQNGGQQETKEKPFNPYMIVTEDIKAKSLENLNKVGGFPVDEKEKLKRILSSFENRGGRLMKRHSMPLLLDETINLSTHASATKAALLMPLLQNNNYKDLESLYAHVDLKKKYEDQQRKNLYATVEKPNHGFKTFYPSKRQKPVDLLYDGQYSVIQEKSSKSLPSSKTPDQMNEASGMRKSRLKSWSPYSTADGGDEGMYETIRHQQEFV